MARTVAERGGAALLLASLAAGCGARSDLDDTADADTPRVAEGGGDTPEVLLDGFPMALAIAGDTLYAHVVLRQPGDVFVGALLRLPKSGGAPTAMATTDAWGKAHPPSYGQSTGGLEADAGHIYFIEICTDPAESEYRLVSLPVDHVISL